METKAKRPEKWSKKDEELLHAAALLLGFNQLALEADKLGTKVFYRLLRDEQEKRFAKLGGKIDYREESPTLTLHERPELKFKASDIEAMRALVAEHDANKESRT